MSSRKSQKIIKWNYCFLLWLLEEEINCKTCTSLKQQRVMMFSDIDDCETVTCKATTSIRCLDLVDDYHCECLPGWTGQHCDTSATPSTSSLFFTLTSQTHAHNLLEKNLHSLQQVVLHLVGVLYCMTNKIIGDLTLDSRKGHIFISR